MNRVKILKEFESISLDDLDDPLFKNRYDKKYLFSSGLLNSILERLTGSYRVLTIDSHYIQDYESLYFDNREFKFYLDHHNGKLNRYKVRFRKYPGSKLIFIEIKLKNNRDQTKKWREKISKTQYCQGVLADRETRFLNSFFRNSPGRLFPRFRVAYSRLALIHKQYNERVTIDLDLSYLKGSEKKIYKDIAIAEVKQGTLGQNSDFFNVMRERRIQPIHFSKYCFGIYQFYPFLKYNRFKSRYLFFEKVCNNGGFVILN